MAKIRGVFTVTISGVGNSQEEAWNDAIDSFALDPGEIPESVIFFEEEFDE